MAQTGRSRGRQLSQGGVGLTLPKRWALQYLASRADPVMSSVPSSILHLVPTPTEVSPLVVGRILFVKGREGES